MAFEKSSRSPEEILLETMSYEPVVFWSVGSKDTSLQIFTDLEHKIDLFDLSFYDGMEDDPTICYLKEHSIDDILSGNNPDMIPFEVNIIEGGLGIIDINFKCSKKLRDMGVDDFFPLNGKLLNPRFGVTVKHKDQVKEKHIIGYTQSGDPYVRSFYDRGVTSSITFRIVSSF